MALALSVVSHALHAQTTSALDAVAQAMGGKERVLTVRTLILDGAGHRLYFGQTHTPYAATNFTVTAFRRSYEFTNRRWLLDETRESRYLTPMPPAVRLRTGLDGDVGHTVVGNGAMSRVPARTAADRAAEFIYHPIGFVQAAYAPGNSVTEDRDGTTRRILLRVDGVSYTMHVDQRTNLPTRISRVVDHAMLGDVTLQVELSEWHESASVTLPMRIVQRQDRWVLSDSRVTSARVNEDPGNIAATDSVRAATPPGQAAPPTYTVKAEEVAPGVWILDSGLYHTIAIEQSDKIVLVEAPDSDARMLAAIAKARELRPGKPLGPVVNTHHHFDHAGGVRAAMSQGLTTITHVANEDFFRNVVHPRRHTIQPDALERNPQPLKITSVRDRLILRDPMRTVEIHVATGSSHTGSGLIVYLPAERILIQADLETADLISNIERLGLRVEVLQGLHDRPAPWPPR